MNPRDGVYQRLLRLQDLVHQFLSSVKPSKTPTGVEASTFEMPQGVPDNDPAFVSLLKRNASVLDETTPVSRDRDVGGKKKILRTGDGEIDNDEMRMMKTSMLVHPIKNHEGMSLLPLSLK
jgi:hypothetical protein